jgi:hypothetical protein
MTDETISLLGCITLPGDVVGRGNVSNMASKMDRAIVRLQVVTFRVFLVESFWSHEIRQWSNNYKYSAQNETVPADLQC